MSNRTSADDHLRDLEDGAGCTEIWEKLSEQREPDAAEAADGDAAAEDRPTTEARAADAGE
ncbi:hypothetical protein [Halobaculum sp. EA56]|uniref:hypothetical protein n=1 Tax=Halobaculum sp. EA56 TaxID=3421648 RepID=UPI003EBC2A0F